MNAQSQKRLGLSELDTAALHRRQVTWQVWVPLGIFLVIILFLLVLATMGTANNPTVGMKWASISLIFLIIPTFFAGLVLLSFLGLIAFYLGKLLKVFPLYSLILRTYVYRASAAILKGLDQVVRPILAIQGWLASLERLLSSLSR